MENSSPGPTQSGREKLEQKLKELSNGDSGPESLNVDIPDGADKNPQPLGQDAPLPDRPLPESAHGSGAHDRKVEASGHPIDTRRSNEDKGESKGKNANRTEETRQQAKTSGETTSAVNSSTLPAGKDHGDTTPVLPYSTLLSLMGNFLSSHRNVSHFRLKIAEIKPGQAVIFQGQLTEKWATLSEQESFFVRTSLLRALLNLADSESADDQLLYSYFKNYSLSTGRKHRTNGLQ